MQRTILRLFFLVTVLAFFCTACTDAPVQKDNAADSAPQSSSAGAEYTDLSFLNAEQRRAFDVTRRYRAAWYHDIGVLEQMYFPDGGSFVAGPEEPPFTAQLDDGTEIVFLCTELTFAGQTDAQHAVMSVELCKSMMRATQLEYRIHLGNKNRLYVNKSFYRAGSGELQPLEELRGKLIFADEEKVEFDLLPEAWETSASDAVRVVLEKRYKTEGWRVTAWPAPSSEDRWQDSAVPLQSARTIGKWEEKTYIWDNGSLRCLDAAGTVLWEETAYVLPVPQQAVWVSDAGTSGMSWLFLACGVGNPGSVVCAVNEEGKIALVGADWLGAEQQYGDIRVDSTGRWVLWSVRDAYGTQRSCRFDLKNCYWEWAEKDGLMYGLLDMERRVLASNKDETSRLFVSRLNLPDLGEQAALVMVDDAYELSRLILGIWSEDMQVGFLQNEDLYIMRDDGVEFRSAENYTKVLPFAMRFGELEDGSVRRLHTFRRDPVTKEFFVVYSVAGQDTYCLAFCDTQGVPLYERDSGVPVIPYKGGLWWPTVLALRGTELHLMTERTASAEGWTLAVFDVSAQQFVAQP